MKKTKILAIVGLVLGLMVYLPKASEAKPMGTAWTYQGRLMDANQPADGLYDFTFKLYDAGIGGSKAANDVHVGDLDVIDGYFTVELDFGSDAFNGDAQWLEIGVRSHDPCDTNPYTRLLPRQEVTATPYALQTRGIFVDNARRVGIGTTTPTTKLEVEGDVKFMGGDASVWLGNKAVTLRQDSSHTYLSNKANFVNNGSESNGQLFINGEAGIQLRYGADGSYGTAALVVDGTGNVGIGTTSPTSLLDVHRGAIRSSRDNNQYIEILDIGPQGAFISALSRQEAKKSLAISAFHDGTTGTPGGETQLIFRVGNVSDPNTAMTIRENGNIDMTGDVHANGSISTGNGITAYHPSKVGPVLYSRNGPMTVPTWEHPVAIYGHATEPDIHNIGGLFKANGLSGIGVKGEANSDVSINYGGFFEAEGEYGRGVYGKASATASKNYGGLFEAAGETGVGVQGTALNTGSDENYGGFFSAYGQKGIGVTGTAWNNGDGVNYGGLFVAWGESGMGVCGKALNTGGSVNYGGYFEALGAQGIGV